MFLLSWIKCFHDGWFYHLDGFPYAFQVWFYDCYPYIICGIGNFFSGYVPRILNWTCNRTPSFKVLQRRIFHESAAKVTVFLFLCFMFMFFYCIIFFLFVIEVAKYYSNC